MWFFATSRPVVTDKTAMMSNQRGQGVKGFIAVPSIGIVVCPSNLFGETTYHQ